LRRSHADIVRRDRVDPQRQTIAGRRDAHVGDRERSDRGGVIVGVRVAEHDIDHRAVIVIGRADRARSDGHRLAALLVGRAHGIGLDRQPSDIAARRIRQADAVDALDHLSVPVGDRRAGDHLVDRHPREAHIGQRPQ